jgi:SAM-dependent methyltransferase
MVKFDEYYWQSRYQNEQTGWDIGYPSTPIKEYIDQLENKQVAILIPGAGNAYEAEYLAGRGFENVTIIDISKLAIESVRTRVGDKITYIHGDFFEHQGAYDLVIEQTFFCAIDPELRLKYVEKMSELMAPHGRLVGLLWDAPMNPDHPPFGGDQLEYRNLFGDKYNLAIMETAYNSIPPRKGRELFIKFVKK